MKTIYRNRKLLDLARDQRCVMCHAEDGTVVAAHSNLQDHGKGMGIKAHDGMSAWLCSMCHSHYDTGGLMSRQDRNEFIYKAILRTTLKMWQDDLIQVK